MNAAPATPAWKAWAGALLLALAVWAAYGNSLSGPFILDDSLISRNPTIRHLWPLWNVVSPPHDHPYGRNYAMRPVVNLSFALNYAAGGLSVRGYHVANIAIHLAAGLLLFGIVRRTLEGASLRERYGSVALPLAWTAALLWLVHPLQTEAVTYLLQRAESLMGFFYLLTLYTFIRAEDSARPRRWLAVSVVACLLGMGTKEVMASAPLIVLAYDRTFRAGNFAAAWRGKRSYYLALAATWLWLAFLVGDSAANGGENGFGGKIAAGAYAWTQFPAIVHYLKLCVVPYPLVFDYGNGLAHGLWPALPCAILVIGLLGATAWALWKRPVAGFLGLWFFAVLAPSSSFVPIVEQTMAEHRMYLALVPLAVGAVLLGWNAFGRRGLIGFFIVALAFAALTFGRNCDYRSVISIWTDTVKRVPENPRAQTNLAYALLLDGRDDEAISHLETSLVLQPDSADAEEDLGVAFFRMGRKAEAIAHLSRAIEIDPESGASHAALGSVLLSINRPKEALQQLDEAILRMPASPGIRFDRAEALLQLGHAEAARAEYERVLFLQPDHAGAISRITEMTAPIPGAAP